MSTASHAKTQWHVFAAVVAWLVFASVAARAEISTDEAAGVLRGKYGALYEDLVQSPFHRPIHLDSTQTPQALRGDVYALVDYPFTAVSTAIGVSAQWCEILLLHINVKGCTATGGSGDRVTAFLGAKHDEPLRSAYRLEFVHRVSAASADYVKVVLNAAQGPFGTRNYEILLEAIPISAGGTFLHLGYSYGYGPAAMMAMRAYLNTIGRAKVGFTIIGRRSSGEPIHVGDVRGALERNTMRYFLALDAYLGASSVPPQQRLDKRLRDWFSACELYPLQLREVPQEEYLAMKRREYRQSAMLGASGTTDPTSADDEATVN